MTSPDSEYLRRAAEAAERTRRNSTILVWALVGVPVIIAVVAVAVAYVLGQRRARGISGGRRY